MPHRPETELKPVVHNGFNYGRVLATETERYVPPPIHSFSNPVVPFSERWNERNLNTTEYTNRLQQQNQDVLENSLTYQAEENKFHSRHQKSQSSSLPSESPSQEESPTSLKENLSITSESSVGSNHLSSKEPSKKRKKHLDFLRRNRCWLPTQHGESSSSIRVPSPSSSVESNRDPTERETSTPKPTGTFSSDFEDARPVEEYQDSKKSSKNADITPSLIHSEVDQYAVVPDLPELLHAILSRGDRDCPILEWLHHGMAWKVVRWDALRTTLLPQVFPQCCFEMDDGTLGGSIDAFLWNVRIWGFQEIKDGSDARAYTHENFQRESPEICHRMQPMYSLTSVGDSSKHSLNESETQTSGTSGFLRVPSLATSRSDNSGENISSDHPERIRLWHPYAGDDPTRAPHPYYESYFGNGCNWSYPANGTYIRHEYNANSHYPIHAYPRQAVTIPSPYDSRYPFRPHYTSNGAEEIPTSTSKISIRSGRGGIRLGTRSAGTPGSVVSEPTRRYPVSQRGRGRTRLGRNVSNTLPIAGSLTLEQTNKSDHAGAPQISSGGDANLELPKSVTD